MIGARPNGYTVLELMIVIAVSASMFVAVAIAFGGRQQEIQFTQAVRDLDARIADAINDVSTGYFNNSGTLECSVVATDSTARPTLDGTPSASEDAQGFSDNCVFIGKAIQFAPLSSDLAPVQQPDVINVYNIVGRRKNNGATTNSIQQARPVAVAPSTIPDAVLESHISKIRLQYGLKITDVVDSVSPIPTAYGAIGFFTTFSQSFNTPTGDDITLSNNQNIRYGAIPSTSLNQSPIDAVSSINKITDQFPATSPDLYIDTTSNVVVAGVRPRAITICVRSVDNKRRAAIVIGANGTTSTQIQFDNYDGAKCVS
jgi:type II secretory pathway pseudopilin PulG